MSRNIDNHICINVLNLRIDVFAEIIHTFVLQSHTIEHALWSFSHTRIIITLTRFQSSTFHDNTTDFFQWYEIGKFQTISECAGSCHYRVLQLQIMYIYI